MRTRTQLVPLKKRGKYDKILSYEPNTKSSSSKTKSSKKEKEKLPEK